MMKILVTGTRGIPDIPGGVEKHCQELFPLVAAAGTEVIVATRRSYVKPPQPGQWQGIALRHLYAPGAKSLEAIVHTFLAVLTARKAGVDILHIHAVGPGLLVPLARLLGLQVVFTHHGSDYLRQKWGRTAKVMLRLGEYLAGRYAHEVIAISAGIRSLIHQRCGRTARLIPNGVPRPPATNQTDFLEQLGLVPKRYILCVSRFVPEKGLDLLIRAFAGAKTEMKLVLAGDADHDTPYSQGLKNLADQTPGVIRTGYITGEPLAQIYTHARLFVLPSFHEGLPIALLEALSYDLPVLASDIDAHKEIPLPGQCYFRCGSVPDLTASMENRLARQVPEAEREYLKTLVREHYDWKRIAGQTLAVYLSLCPDDTGSGPKGP